MSELLSRARNAEDLDCPRRDFGPICQGKLIRELADEIERLRFAAKNAVESHQEALGGIAALKAEIKRLRADNDRLYAATRDILASPPAGVSNAVVSEVEKGA